MVFKKLKLNISVSEQEFNYIYPPKVAELSQRHFTPVSVAKTAATFLGVDASTKVLDVGAGVGKFCMIGACHTQATYYGLEQRKWMVDLAKEIAWKNDLQNVQFIHENMIRFRIKDFSAIYFFNSFHENIDDTSHIDDSASINLQRYEKYHRYLQNELNQTSLGTRLATYWVERSTVPETFVEIASFYNDKLLFWEKKW